MSDTRLFISPEWTAKDVKEVFEKRFKTKTRINCFDWAAGEYQVLEFKLDSDSPRQMSIHSNSEVSGFRCLQLCLRSNEESIEIMGTLAKTFGGFLQEHDTGDDYIGFCKPGTGNIDFVVREAIKDDPALGDDVPRMASYIEKEKWRNSTEVWNKPNKAKE